MKSVKFSGIPRKKNQFWLNSEAQFRGKNPNSAARLEIPQAAENSGPYSLDTVSWHSLHIAWPLKSLLEDFIALLLSFNYQ